MSEENISIFRQELERVKTQFEDKFQDIMASVRADRENDKRTLQMVNENINNDRKAINQNRALNDKLETLLNVQNTMLSELRSMNNSIKDLSGGGGGMGGILAAGGAAAAAGAGLTAASFFGMGGDTDPAGNGGGTRDTGGGRTRDTGGDGGTRTTSGTSDQRDTALMVYDSFINAGFSPDQARALTGEVHRENAFRNRYLFGSHSDPANQANNIGMISWQGPRRDALLQFMRDYESENEVNLFGSNGEMLQTQEVLNVQAMFLRGEMESGSHGGSQTQNERIQEWLSNPNPSNEESIQAVGGDFIRWALNNPTYRSSGLRNRQAGLDILDEALERRNNADDTPDAERVEGDITTYSTITGTDDNRVAVGKIPLRPNDNNARMYHPRYSSRHAGEEGKEWADYSQFLYPTWEGGELPEGYSLGPNTRTITDPLTGEERRISFNIIENDGFFTTSGPVIDVDENSPVRISVDSGTNISGQLGGAELPTREQAKAIYDTADTRVEDIVGNTEGNDPRGADPYYTPQSGITPSGDAERRAFDEYLFREGGPFTRGEATIPEEPVVTPENDVTGGSTRERRRGQEPQEPEQDETITEFPTLADQFMSGESPTSTDLSPAVETALAPDLPEPPTEEDSGETPRRTTTTGGGGGSREPEQPQIESNAIGRFPWAEKIIKYYNLSDMIKTNMLS